MIKSIFIFILISILSVLTITGQKINNESKSADLIVNIVKFESDSGFVRVHLYNNETKDYFPLNSGKAIKVIVTKIHNKTSQVIFDNLKPGDYAITVHHDRNSNIKMDLTWYGLPAEGWGISNNIKPVMRIPGFDECKFRVDSSTHTEEIEINN